MDRIESRNRTTDRWTIDVQQRWKGNAVEKAFQQMLLKQLDILFQNHKLQSYSSPLKKITQNGS